MKKVGLLVVSALLALTTQANAGLMGETLEVNWLFPNENSVAFGPYAVVVASGSELTLDIGGQAGPEVGINIEDNFASVLMLNTGVFSDGVAFNGIVFSDALGVIPDFTSVTLDPGSSLPNVAVSFDADHIFLNFVNSGWFSFGRYAKIDIETAAVPEPSTLLLLGSAFLGLGFLRARRVTIRG